LVGGASVLINKLDPLERQARTATKVTNVNENFADYQDAAVDYLFRLNTSKVGILNEYRSRAAVAIKTKITSKHSIDPIQQQRLAKLSECLANLLIF
jgi:hypothetical protein